MINNGEISPEELHTLNEQNHAIARLKTFLSIEKELVKNIFESQGENLKPLFPKIEILGAGSESVVVVDPKDKDKVISLAHDTRYFSGVAPFSENRNFHNLLQTLHPESFASLHKVKGILRRETSREKVFGDPAGEKIFDLDDMIKKDLKELGIDYSGIDYLAADNALIDSHGQIKFVDMVDGTASGVRHIDLRKIKKYYQNKFHITDSELDDNKGWKTIMRSLAVLKELDIVNEVFNKISDSSEPSHFSVDIHDPKYENIVNSFHFLNAEEDKKSIKRIKIWLTHAIKAVTNEGHVYKNGQWIT